MSNSPLNSMRGAFQVISRPIPRIAFTTGAVVDGQGVINDVVGVAATLLLVDSAANPSFGVRRLRFLNRSANNISLLTLGLGVAFGAQSILDGEVIPSGAFVERIYAAGVRLGIVADAAASSFSATISDT